MKSILAGYITAKVLEGGLGQSADTSTSIIHTFVFANYFMPLLGAWLSDRVIGRYHTILWVSLFYCVGHGVLACSDLFGTVSGKMYCLYAGLALIAFGSGGIKPCVSAFMGDQFKPEQSHLLQKAYGAFYWSINFGSFFSFLIIPWIKDHYSYSLAFGVPGILMAVATLIFWLGTKHYVRVPPSRATKTAGFIPVFVSALRKQSGPAPLIYLFTTLGIPLIALIAMTIVAFARQYVPIDPQVPHVQKLNPLVRAFGWTAMGCVGLWYLSIVVNSLLGRFELPESFWQRASDKYSEKEISAARSVGPILFIFALIPVFWSLFDQTNSTWVLQGQKMIPTELFGFKIGAEQMQSANPALVMILVPLLTLGVYPWLGRFASPLRRMSYGFVLAALSYVIVALIQAKIENGAQLSVLWQTVPYIVLTIAEVLISTTGLEFAFRESAPSMKSTIMSFWLVTVAFGNLFVTTITKVLTGPDGAGHAESVSTGRVFIYAGLTFAVGILFSIVAAHYRYRDEAAARGK